MGFFIISKYGSYGCIQGHVLIMALGSVHRLSDGERFVYVGIEVS